MQSLTASYAQTGDTVTCYNNEEMQRIATRVVRAKECDTLLNLVKRRLEANKNQIEAMDEMLSAKDSIIDLSKNVITTKEEIIIGLNIEIDSLRKNERKIKRREWLTRAGLIGAGVAIVAMLLSR